MIDEIGPEFGLKRLKSLMHVHYDMESGLRVLHPGLDKGPVQMRWGTHHQVALCI